MSVYSILLSVLFLTGCTVSSTYDLSALSEVKVSPAPARRLSFTLPLESLYYSPGLLRSKKDALDAFSVVRCQVGKQCKVDVKSQVGQATHEVELPADTTKKFYLIGKNGTTAELE